MRKGVFFSAWTYNGTVPGPVIRATEGDLLRVTLIPGEHVELLQVAPFGGPLTIRANGRDVAISRQLGDQIDVSA